MSWTDLIHHRDDGIAVIDNQGHRFTLFVPSRKRAKRVINHPLFRAANIIVHESEYDDYAAAFRQHGVQPGSLLTHDVQGLSKIHNRMLDYFDPESEGWQLHTDDDYAGLMYLHTFRSRKVKIRDPQKIIDILTATGMVATEAGTGLFCFAQTAIPHERHSFNPFRLRGWGMAACMGLIDPELRFDEALPLSIDIDMCLQAVAKHRFIWQEMRYWGWCEEKGGRTGADPGGLAGIRVPSVMENAHAYLRDKWGDGIITLKGRKNRGQGLTVRVKIPQGG